jgi:acyl-CoA thioesterase FadM
METKQQFLKPISYGEKIRGELTVSEINKASVVFEYKLFTQIFVHQACSKMVFVRTGADKYKITPLPEELIEYFKGYVVTSKFND